MEDGVKREKLIMPKMNFSNAYAMRISFSGIIALSILLPAGSTCAIPVEEWNRTYRDALFNDIREISDGGYILAGYKYSNERGLLGAYLIRADPNGSEADICWRKAHGIAIQIMP